MGSHLFVTFVYPEDYSHHAGQVVSVGPDGLKVVRRRFSVKNPWGIEVVPMFNVSQVEYEAGAAPVRAAIGVLMLALLIAIVVGLVVYWNHLEPGTTIPVGALGVAWFYGLKWAFTSRRHQLTFHLHDGRKVRWRSRTGDFEPQKQVASYAVECLKELGYLVHSRG